MRTDPERRPAAGEAPDRTTANCPASHSGAGLTVAVLMCTYQGAAHLAEQLESIGAQTHTRWKLWVSDDGSTDDTLAILQRYRDRWGAGRLEILQGPRVGSMANFMTLTCNPAIEADCFAWADQDDVWEADKLARSVAWMASNDGDTAALYGTRTQLIDEGGAPIGCSPRFTRPPSFQNALVQSIAGGNTMLFNAAARALLMRVGANISALAHDWWIYIVVSACGGRVHYDPWPSVRYRQHGRNQYGTNLGFSARWLRMRLLLGGQFRQWVDANLASLQPLRASMPPQQAHTLDAFSRARQAGVLARLAGLRQAGIHRQTLLANVGLTVAALINRI